LNNKINKIADILINSFKEYIDDKTKLLAIFIGKYQLRIIVTYNNEVYDSCSSQRHVGLVENDKLAKIMRKLLYDFNCHKKINNEIMKNIDYSIDIVSRKVEID